MVPAAFPALPACLLPAGNPASASLATAARVRGHRWGQDSGFTHHSWVALAVALDGAGAALWHLLCTTRRWKRGWKKAQLSLRTPSCLPLCIPGQAGGMSGVGMGRCCPLQTRLQEGSPAPGAPGKGKKCIKQPVFTLPVATLLSLVQTRHFIVKATW